MRKSVELARKGLGYTSPNPLVGCVIVKHGNIVGQGFHPKPGQPHAEVSLLLTFPFQILFVWIHLLEEMCFFRFLL